MTYRPLVYMCHPYSSDPAGNVVASMHKWDELMTLDKFVLINPLWSHAQHCELQRPYEFWLKYDLRLIERCDAVYRVAGDSPGADREVAHAQRHGLPVFTEVTNLVKWCETWSLTKPALPANPVVNETADSLTTIQHDRQAIYGDPVENHRGIAMQWAPMLQPHWEAIRDMQALPPHVVALLMALVKVNRMRRVFHADNYDDAQIYLNTFAREWQEKGLT